jgi:uncharacterized protein (DUF4415 family)
MKTRSSRSLGRKSPGSGRRRKRLNLKGLMAEKKKVAGALHTMRIADFYKPLKKPVTLRLDADVIAWFKKDGRRYQTRINQALRKVMEKELKGK